MISEKEKKLGKLAHLLTFCGYIGAVLWLVVAKVFFDESWPPADRWEWVGLLCGVAVAFILIPLGNLIAPLVVGRLNGESDYVRYHGRVAFDFQVVFTILTAIGVVLWLVVAKIFDESSPWADRWEWAGLLCGLVAFSLFGLCVVRAASRAGQGVFCTYPVTIRGLVLNIDTIVGRGSGLLFAGLVLPMVGGLCYEVFARYLFNAPTIWAYDVTYILYGSHFMLGAAYTLYKGSHIRTDMLYENFTLQWKGIVDASMYLVFFFPGMLFFMFAGWEEALHAWGIGERSDASPWRPIIYPFKTVVSVAAGLLMLQGVSEFLKSAHAAIKDEFLVESEPPVLRGDII